MDFDARNTDDVSDRERQAMSYAAVGAVLGITPARVRQLEQRALKKLRRALEKQGVRSSRFAG
jgi:DNA-directed RNA polymerase sigma subunit (sigma70/sigma32)